MRRFFKRFVIAIGRLLFVFRRRQPVRDPRTIAVLKIGALGDVIMSTPLLRSLRRMYPRAKILYIVGKWSASPLRGNSNVDRIIEFDERIVWRFRLSVLIKLLTMLRREHIDLGFVLDKHYSAGLFAFLSGIAFRVGFNRRGEGFANNLSVTYGPVRHEVEYNLDLLRLLRPALVHDDTRLEVPVSQHDSEHASARLRELSSCRRFVGIAAGGAQNPSQAAFLKRWPLRHYCDLTRMIVAKNPDVCVLLLGGPTDREVNQTVRRACPDRTVDVAGDVSVQESVALMSHCLVVVTHDSGPMHMAAASGTPVVSLSGPVHPGRTTPLGQRHVNLWKPQLPGALCYDDEGNFPKGVVELPCLVEIIPREVYQVLTRYGLNAS